MSMKSDATEAAKAGQGNADVRRGSSSGLFTRRTFVRKAAAATLATPLAAAAVHASDKAGSKNAIVGAGSISTSVSTTGAWKTCLVALTTATPRTA